jgi:hypothetical protein
LHGLVAVMLASGSSGLSVTWNGAPCTLLVTAPTADGQVLRLYGIDDPTAGNVEATWTGGADCWFAWQCFSGRNGVRASSATADSGFSGTAQTRSVTSASGDDVADFFIAGASSTIGAGQTPAWTASNRAGYWMHGSYEAASGTTTDMSWTPGSAVWFHHVAVALQAAGGGGPPANTHRLTIPMG